jgi:hypothetical protein
MGTKSQTHLKTFYAQYRKRYKLDDLIKQYRADQCNTIIELSDDDDEQVSNLKFMLFLSF